MTSRRARQLVPAAAAIALALAAAYGLVACGGASPTATTDPQSPSRPAVAPPSSAQGAAARPNEHSALAGEGDAGSTADGGVARTATRSGAGDGADGPRWDVADAKSTCSSDEQCVLTRYPGCCCSTVESAMPRAFAISRPDLEARKQWCDSHVERIDCDVSRCPPPAQEQPEPEARTVACVDGLCVSRTAEP